MLHILATLLFRFLRVGRCPACGRIGRFSHPLPAIRGPIPAEVEGAVPLICRCTNGCTSSVRAIIELELRTVKA